MKKYSETISVLEAARIRIKEVFDGFDKIYLSFSGGKDSTVMLHLVMEEAIKRNRKIGLLIIDLEAQYSDTIKHINSTIDIYKDNIELHWFCGELLLRNALTNFEPRWVCWDEAKKDMWIREKPERASDLSQYDFYVPKMEFEELMIIFGDWYGKGEKTAAFVGIRADESLHRYCAIATWDKNGKMFNNRRWTTKVGENTFNIYPIYDWATQDIWTYHGKYPEKTYNKIYDKMQMAGVKLSQQRLCQPYGDDQRRGIWLYHIIEPNTWFKLIARVNGVNSGSIYINEIGNITGYDKINCPNGHTWKSFTNFLLRTMPKKTRNHYRERFIKFIAGWKRRGYVNSIPDFAPQELESKQWVPSWRRMAKSLLRNDYWCKGLGFTQPKSEAYSKFKELKKKKAEKALLEKRALDIGV
jgi:predicted phosphoadenosine phosphosulfate sulfurtransferase